MSTTKAKTRRARGRAQMAERARVKQVETPAGGHEMGDPSLQDCQRLAHELAEAGIEVPVSAVARWTEEMRSDVGGWLAQYELQEVDPPQWLSRTHQLMQALEPYDEAQDAWKELADEGASDGTILSMVAAVLEEQRVSVAGTDFGPVCWSIDPERQTSVWFGEDEPPRRKADLEGASLVAAVRGLYGVQAPAPPAADVPGGRSTSAGGNGSGRKQSKSGPKLSHAGRETGLPLTIEIDPGLIDRFPGNPRDELEFDEAELLDLGEDLKRRQVQPCTVRRFGERYQLIAGERRWRAAKLVSLPALRCEVVDVSDAEAMWMCGAENEKRSEWSPIARARWYRNVREAEGISVEELAERVGVSQGHVSSTINLLDLPDEWQRRIISREMTPTCVRPLIPWAKKRPQVLEQVETELKLPGSKAKQPREPKDKVTVREMEDAVRASLRKCTRSMNRNECGGNGPLFSVSKERRELLDVENIKLHSWEGPVNRAWNTKEWDRLQKEAKARKKEKGEDETKTSSTSSGTYEWTAVWGVSGWLSDWVGKLLAAEISDDAEGRLQALRVLLAIDGMEHLCDEFGRTWKELSDVTSDGFLERLPAVAREVLTDTAWIRAGDSRGEMVAGMTASFGIDLASRFVPDASLLNHFALQDLCQFAGVGKEQKKLRKPELIEHLLANWKSGWVPKLVREQLGIKNAPAKPKTARRKKTAAQASGN